MRKVRDDIVIVDGVLYTDMNFDFRLLSEIPGAVSVHAKGDVHFGVTRRPNRMNLGDYYLRYEEFLKEFPLGIRDVIGFSRI